MMLGADMIGTINAARKDEAVERIGAAMAGITAGSMSALKLRRLARTASMGAIGHLATPGRKRTFPELAR